MKQRLLRYVGALVLAIGVLTSCTIRQGRDYQVDLGLGWYMTMYQVPSMLITAGIFFPCNWDINCTVERLKREVEIRGEKTDEFWSALDDHRTGDGGFEWVMHRFGVEINAGRANLQTGSECILLKQELFQEAYWTVRPKDAGECRFKGD